MVFNCLMASFVAGIIVGVAFARWVYKADEKPKRDSRGRFTK